MLTGRNVKDLSRHHVKDTPKHSYVEEYVRFVAATNLVPKALNLNDIATAMLRTIKHCKM